MEPVMHKLEVVASQDGIWSQLRASADEAARREPHLGSLMNATILSHTDLANALSFQIARKIGDTELVPMSVREVCAFAFWSDPTIVAAAEADLQAVAERDPAIKSLLQPFLYFKGFQALQAWRVAHWLWGQGRETLAFHFQSRISELFQVDIHPAARVGSGIFLDHGTGIVIGETAVVGDEVLARPATIPRARFAATEQKANSYHLVAEGGWPDHGQKLLDGLAVVLGITWKPTPGGVFTRFHISDIWLDDTAVNRASHNQSAVHKAFIRSRWMPAWIDAVEYGKFGRATVTATLFGGMDASLYADFKKGVPAFMNAAENTLKHTEGGTAGPTQMAARGSILDVTRTAGDIALGSSGIQIRFDTDLITEGMRPARVVLVRPADWPDVHTPREEYLKDGASDINERFPSPTIFPKY